LEGPVFFGGFVFLILWFVLFCHDSALVTLEQRFARGAIDSEEFKKRRQELLTR
jgi:putative oligomerization/nucleic acid binding protein